MEKRKRELEERKRKDLEERKIIELEWEMERKNNQMMNQV